MVIERPDGSRQFRVYNPHASSIEIQGDVVARAGVGAVGGCAGIPLVRELDGWWSLTLRLPEGDHTFRYMINGQTSMPDYAANGVLRDRSGAWVSCVCVPPRSVEEPVPALPEALPAGGSEARTPGRGEGRSTRRRGTGTTRRRGETAEAVVGAAGSRRRGAGWRDGGAPV